MDGFSRLAQYILGCSAGDRSYAAKWAAAADGTVGAGTGSGGAACPGTEFENVAF